MSAILLDLMLGTVLTAGDQSSQLGASNFSVRQYTVEEDEKVTLSRVNRRRHGFGYRTSLDLLFLRLLEL